MSARYPSPTEERPASSTSGRLQQIVSGPDEAIELAEAALLIATHVYPDLDVAHYLARIEELAKTLESRIQPDSSSSQRILALNEYLFAELGFAANEKDYYDPRNSCLNDVLDRRVGIPITLSLLYMEIGVRVGLPLQGVSFPGHFLVKCALPEGTVVLDPYSGGISVGLADLQKRLADTRESEVSSSIVARMLVAAGKKEILLRLLRNLKAIYVRSQTFDRALQILHWIVAMAPDQPPELRDRAMIYQELECPRAALADFERYLELSPGCDDRDQIRSRIVELQRQSARLN
ncbi:MAG TPA: tetratricopeptide repeat protein [Burkholderiales bacterium]|nr:tetratricopeptide repeat protein [Burkholderiales bacterium]